ncbi:PP2C family protein-serine/threonine phosphatase [Streptomyces sp. NPDC001833]|uniref:PP2C family protein-serine/threonine phosphatase n=1 Tax=Streptomyces sp. NPDC001833 TaxID=3154658 RepID=UPI00332EE5A4
MNFFARDVSAPGPDSRLPRGRTRAHLVLPLLLIAAITLSASFAPLAIHLSPLLVAAPTCTAAVARVRFTVAMALTASAAVVLIDWHDGLLHSPLLPIHIGALLAVSGSAVAARALHDRDLRELTQVRAVSEAAQRVLLRPIPHTLGSLRIASMYRAATAHALVGGDLYAAVRSGHATRFLIGDVRGKGLPAVEDASALLGAFREAAPEHETLPQLAASLERSVRRHLAEMSERDPDSAERFITALLIELPDAEETVRVVSCGHPPPLRRQRGGVTHLCVDRPAPPLGLAGSTAEAFPFDTFAFFPGDTLLLYTDGLAEARDATGTFYPVLERAATWTWCCPHSLLQHISHDLDSYAGQHLDDDLAMVAVQRPALHQRPTMKGQ